MNEFFGWVQGSDMASVYVHLSGRDVDNALLKVYGIKNEQNNRESILKPKECGRCKEANQFTNKFCSRCGLPLDQEAIAEVLKKDTQRAEADKVLDKLIEDRKFREILIRKIEMIKTNT